MPFRSSAPLLMLLLAMPALVACVDSERPPLPGLAPLPEGTLAPGGGRDASAEGAVSVDGTAPTAEAPDTTLSVKPAALSNDAKPRFEFTSADATGFVCKIDSADAVPCTSPFIVTVAEGQHTFAVAAVSKAGVPDPSPATFSWSTDLTPPKTTITSAPLALDNSADVSFAFSAAETVTFECALDSAAFSACTSPHQEKALADGAHTFAVRAIDAAGNVEASAAPASFTISTVLPDTTVDSGPSASVSSTGASFTFSSPNAGTGATFACSLDGAAFTACTSPFSANALSDSAHTFEVRVTDAAGNTDPTPAKRAWTVDTIAPSVTITSGPTGTVSTKQPQFDFTLTGGGALECKLDGAAYATCTSPFVVAAPLTEGGHTFYVRATDAAKNSAVASRAFIVDTVAPVVAITGGPSGPTNVSKPTFTFTSGGASQVQCRFGSSAFSACTSPFTPTVALVDGPYTFEVRGLDAASNVTSATRSFTVDTIVPGVTISGGPSGATNDATPTFTFTTSGTPSAVECRIGTVAPFAACTSPYTPAALGDGAHAVYVRATDAAGNVTTQSRNFSVDTAAPTLAITGGPTGVTNMATPSFTFTTAGATTTQCRASGIQYDTGWAPCASPYVPTLAGTREYTIEVRANDAVGNVASASRTFTWDIDSPYVQINGKPLAIGNNTNVSFTWGGYEIGSSIAVEQCRFGTAAFFPCTSGGYSTTLSDGNYTFQVQWIDGAGNVGSSSWAFTIDTVAPAVSSSVPLWQYAGWTLQVPFSAEAGASTFCRVFAYQGAPSGAYTPCASPYSFTMGYDWVTFEVRAVDAAGNAQSAFTNIASCGGESCGPPPQ